MLCCGYLCHEWRRLLAVATLGAGAALIATLWPACSRASVSKQVLALPDAALAQAGGDGRVRQVLLVTHTAGFRHGSIPVATEVLKQLGQRTGLWETEVAANAEEVAQKLTGAHLKGKDLVIFANTTGELPVSEENKAAFQAWLEAGKGFVGMHSATDTFYRWPFYGKMIAGYFDGHPWHQKVVVRVEDAKFPGLQSLGASFEITDEIYQFRNWSREDKHVLLSIDNASIDVTKGKRADQDYAVAWARTEGRGRVFYTSLGHRNEVWTDARYQEHILGGIRWALGVEKYALAPGRGAK